MSEPRKGGRGTNKRPILRLEGEWRECKGVFRYIVYLTPKKEGGFSVVAPRLPSVISDGSTEKEALANIAEALKRTITLCKEQGVDIPRTETPAEPGRGVLERCVIVQT